MLRFASPRRPITLASVFYVGTLTLLFAPSPGPRTQAAPEGEPAGNQVRIPYERQAGQSYRLRLIRERERDGRRTRSVTPIEARVLQADESGTLLRWTPGEARLPGLDDSGEAAFTQELSRRLANLGAGAAVEFRTGPDGTPGAVENQAELAQHAAGRAQELKAWLRREARGAPSPRLERLEAMVDRLLEDRGGLHRELLADAALYHSPLGGVFPARGAAPLELEDERRTALLDEPLPVRVRIRTEASASDDSALVLNIAIELPEEARAELGRRLRAGESGNPDAGDPGRTNAAGERDSSDYDRREANPPLKVELSEFIRYEIDLRNGGWVRAADYRRTIRLGERVNEERTRIELIEGPPPR